MEGQWPGAQDQSSESQDDNSYGFIIYDEADRAWAPLLPPHKDAFFPAP